jgi:hypothetical protein
MKIIQAFGEQIQRSVQNAALRRSTPDSAKKALSLRLPV